MSGTGTHTAAVDRGASRPRPWTTTSSPGAASSTRPRASTSPTPTPIRSCSSAAGSMPWPTSCRSPTPWCWPPPTPTAARRPARCCSAGSTTRGLTFFTNYESAKGRALAANPQAELLFVWLEVHRQVRVAGRGRPGRRPPSPTRISHLGPATVSSRRGRHRSPRWSPTGRTGGAGRRGRGPIRRRATCPDPRTGAATASCPTHGSSGRAGPAGCTTGSRYRGDGSGLGAGAARALTPVP